MMNVFGEKVEEPLKRCNRCKIAKLFLEFGNDSGGKKKRSWCKECDREVNKDRAEIKKTAPSIPENHICPVCNLNEEQLNESLNPTIRAKHRPWVMDHNHSKKTFRGWICRKCNLGLGNFNDDIRIIGNALNWIKQNEQPI